MNAEWVTAIKKAAEFVIPPEENLKVPSKA
jgi:hypothetical protein